MKALILEASNSKVIQKCEDVDEEVDNVAIDGDSSPDVVVVAVSFDEVTCVIYDEATHY